MKQSWTVFISKQTPFFHKLTRHGLTALVLMGAFGHKEPAVTGHFMFFKAAREVFWLEPFSKCWIQPYRSYAIKSSPLMASAMSETDNKWLIDTRNNAKKNIIMAWPEHNYVSYFLHPTLSCLRIFCCYRHNTGSTRRAGMQNARKNLFPIFHGWFTTNHNHIGLF